MTGDHYDVIVVGARCAGSPTAMLLAARGHRVLLVDRASFPSDTMSTHLLHPPGVSALRRWGLLDQVVATGCPPIDCYRFDFGDFILAGAPGTPDSPVGYAPRRTSLDTILLDAAIAAGAEFRDRFTVTDLTVEDGRVTGIVGHERGGASVVERADVVVGADGLHSVVAKVVAPEQYDEHPPQLVGYYSYWSGLPMDAFETYDRPGRGFAAWATADDLTVVIAGWPYAEFEQNRSDVERHWLATIGLAPEFAERIGRATRVEPFVGAAVPNFFRKPFGPGWALVGDSGYHKDFVTAQGMQDAFRDAELCADAIGEALSGTAAYDTVMSRYQAERDRAVAGIYHLTLDLASLEPPPPELEQMLAAMVGNQPAMDGFARVIAGVTPPDEFFAEAATPQQPLSTGP